MKIKPSQLNIGTELYQYSDKIIPYLVICINEMKTKEHTEIFYILQCQSCIDHNKCELAVKFNDYGDLEYSHMINGYNYDDEYKENHSHYHNEQYYWHRNKDYYWFLTRNEARIFVYEKNINYCKEVIKNSEEIIERKNKEIEEYKEKIQAIQDEKLNTSNNKEV